MTPVTTESGAIVDLDAPAGAIAIEDIAAQLAKQPYMRGATPNVHLPLAQVAVLTAELAVGLDRGVHAAAGLYGLLWNAADAYLGEALPADGAAPTQWQAGAREALSQRRREVNQAIVAAVGLPADPGLMLGGTVAYAAKMAEATVLRDLFPASVGRGALPAPARTFVRPWPWPQALETFLTRFHEYALLAGIDPGRARAARPNL